MISRRSFFKTLPLFSIAPSLFAGHKGDACLDNGFFCMRLVKDEWATRLKITKGPYSTTTLVSGLEGCLRDSHGLCATAELVYLTVQELEFSRENQQIILSHYFEFESPKCYTFADKSEWIDSLRRVRLSNQEKIDIYKVLKKFRGPHNCFWDKPAAERWGIDQMCNWGK